MLYQLSYAPKRVITRFAGVSYREVPASEMRHSVRMAS